MKKYLAWTAIVMATYALFSRSSYAVAEETTVDQLLDLILQSTGTVSSDLVTTTSTSSWSTTSAQTVASQTTPASDTEFSSALAWMHTKWLTQFATAKEYEPENLLTRQQAAKFFVLMQENYIGVPVTTVGTCTYKDTNFDKTLRPYVDKACAYGIMQWQWWLFRPNDFISRPEFIAALVRMMEWAKRDETTNPWWLSYFQQARDWWLTKEQNANAFDVRISRYEAALFLYRASNMIKVAPNPDATNNTGTTTTWWTTASETPSSNTNTISVVSDPALQEAIYWMYDNGITKYNTVENFRPFDGITRQEAAKIFTLFREAIIQGTPDNSSVNCAFTDLDTADSTLTPYITQACQLWILKGSNWIFNPQWVLSKPQAVAILVRMLEWVQDETINPRWQWYYDRAVAMWMIQTSSPTNFDKPITRYEIAMLLYNSKVKYELIKNLNNNFETNKLIYTVADSVTTGSTTWEKVWLISINTQILDRTEVAWYTIDLFGDQYLLEKVATQKYLNNDYVWYGKIISLDKTKNIGTAALTLSNGIVISWVFRPYNLSTMTYYVEPSAKQPYYTMTMKRTWYK